MKEGTKGISRASQGGLGKLRCPYICMYEAHRVPFVIEDTPEDASNHYETRSSVGTSSTRASRRT